MKQDLLVSPTTEISINLNYAVDVELGKPGAISTKLGRHEL